MVVDCLDGRASEEPHSLAGCHEGEFVANTGTEGIEEKTFEWVVVECAICVGYVEAMMPRMECC